MDGYIYDYGLKEIQEVLENEGAKFIDDLYRTGRGTDTYGAEFKYKGKTFMILVNSKRDNPRYFGLSGDSNYLISNFNNYNLDKIIKEIIEILDYETKTKPQLNVFEEKDDNDFYECFPG